MSGEQVERQMPFPRPVFLLSSLFPTMNEESRKTGRRWGGEEQQRPQADEADRSLSAVNRSKGGLELDDLTGRVIGCAIRVHRELGPGFLEAIYENALRIELRHAGIPFRFQGEMAVMYRGESAGLQRFDLLIADQVVVELKAIKALEDIHFAQVRSYLKAWGLRHGLLFNFAALPLTIKRVIYREGDPPMPG